jgi:parallel beta-helix repeat protein
MENAVWLQCSNVTVEYNYIHAEIWTNHDPHVDGIQVPGFDGRYEGINIRFNNIDRPGSSSSITCGGQNGGMHNSEIRGNRLNGGTYCIYFEGNCAGNLVIENEFVSHTFGWINGTQASAQTYTQNTFSGGAPVDGIR